MAEAIRMSNLRNRTETQQTINNMNFDTDDESDTTYNPSSDDYISSQDTDIYEEDKVSSIYTFFYMYVRNKSVATFLSSCMMAICSLFNIVYDILHKISSFTGSFRKMGIICFYSAKKMGIMGIYFILYGFAILGLFTVFMTILYKYGYLSVAPMNYLVSYK